jgi:tetratricopeptide (TPR) repeat protein
MEWADFVRSIAIEQKLSSELIETLIIRLRHENTERSDTDLSKEYGPELEAFKKRLSRIYKHFEQTCCPELKDHPGKGRLEILKACLWQQYERYQSHSFEPAIVGTPSNLPLSGVVKFVGREEALVTVHQKLQAAATVAISSVSGMGGVGKTELAWQYADGKLREAAYPGGVCWVNARAQNVGIGILEFARVQLGLPEPPEALKTVPKQVQWICRRWQGEPILLVLDDVVDYGAVEPYLQALDQRFRVLMTTRLKLGSPAQRLELEVLSEEASLELLRTLLDDSTRIDSQIGDAQDLCQWLGYLPLALELVGRYLLDDEDISLAEMLKLLQQERLAAEALLVAHPEMTASLGVATAFELSWKELNPDAKKLSGLLGIFALAPIPWKLVEQCLPDWQTRNLAQCRDQQLKKRSLLQRVRQERYQLHQLIREFFVAKLETEEAAEVTDQLRGSFAVVLTAVAKTIPQRVTLEVIEQVEDALPHLAVATGLTDWLENTDKIWASTGLAWVAQAQSSWQEAEQWFQKGLEIAEQQLGADHPDTANSLNNLALLYKAMGHYGEAEPLYGRSLAIREQQLGVDHPDTANSLNNLAALYQAMGRYEAAEPLFARSLEIREQQLGVDHPDTANSLNNLAELYRATGRYEAAEPLLARSLEIREQQLGVDHPDTATSLNNLAGIYESMGRYKDAEPLFVRSLEICEQQLGADHPDTASILDNLAGIYESMGRYKDAEPLIVRSLEIREQQLGADHPNTARGLNNLANLYYTMGRYKDAEPLFVRSLAICEQQLGANHPQTFTSLNNLAELYRAMDRYEEAEPLYALSLEIREQQLGADHPDTARGLNNLATLYKLMGRYEDAEPLFVRSLAICGQQLGANHPQTFTSLNNLAELYRAMDRYEEVEPLYALSLAICEQQLGADHPDTAMSLNNLAGLYYAMGRYGKAEPLYLRTLAIWTQSFGEAHPHTQTAWGNFCYLIQQAVQSGRTGELSAHPLTQAVLKEVRGEGEG